MLWPGLVSRLVIHIRLTSLRLPPLDRIVRDYMAKLSSLLFLVFSYPGSSAIKGTGAKNWDWRKLQWAWGERELDDRRLKQAMLFPFRTAVQGMLNFESVNRACVDKQLV